MCHYRCTLDDGHSMNDNRSANRHHYNGFENNGNVALGKNATISLIECVLIHNFR